MPTRAAIVRGTVRETISRSPPTENETPKRPRDDPAIAVTILGEGIAVSAYGRSQVVREGLECAPDVVAVELRVERVQDHLADGRTEMVDGARWRWVDPAMADSEPKIREELASLPSG